MKLALLVLSIAIARCQTNTNWPSVVTIDAGATVDLPGQPAGYQTKDRFFSGGTAYTDPSMGAAGMSTLRFWTPAAPGGYTITGLPAGQYLVRFAFVEPNKTAALQRMFKVSVNGQMSDVLDVFAAVGQRPAVLTVETTAISYFGKMRIDFVSVVGNALVNQIDVLPAFTGPSTLQTVAQSFECIATQPASSCVGLRGAMFLRADGTRTGPYILVPAPQGPRWPLIDFAENIWRTAPIP